MSAHPVRVVVFLVGVAVSVSPAMVSPAVAHAHQPPPRYAVLRPSIEVSSWIGVGGGAMVGSDLAPAVFDLRVGGDFTGALSDEGDVRLGSFLEVAGSNFAGLATVGGLELFIGAVPRPLRLFMYDGEGVFLLRLGAGWGWRTGDLPGRASTPVGSVTLAYGYRAPFSLEEYENQTSSDPDERAAGRYMIGARLWVNTTVDLNDAPAWQITGGIEFEPVGAFRYLFGLY